MKQILYLLMLPLFLTLQSCDVNQTKKGELPEVDVDVDTEAGTMPEYDVNWVDVDLETRTEMVTVPNVKVVMEETEVEVPYLDATWPKQYTDIEEQTLTVEAEVIDYDYELEIEAVYAVGDRLYVISELEKEDTEIGDEVIRVSDQIMINAPNLMIKHYILGEKPARSFNNNYKYISSMNEISDKIKNADKIYG